MRHFITRQSEKVNFNQPYFLGGSGMRFFYPIVLAFMLSTPIALAQEPSDDETQLEEIVVTATRIPTPLADTLPSTVIITAEEIERIKPRDFGNLLSRKSGLNFRDSGGRGSSGGIFVRGANSDHVLILINGVRTGSATLGSTAIENIPLESIERIEIIKGPVSGVYGSDAIGGVIQIFTKKHQEEGTFGSLESTFGTNKFLKYDAQAGYGDEGYSVYASLSKESTDGIDRTAFKGGGNEDDDSFKQTSGNLSITANLQDNLVLAINHVQSSATTEYDNTNARDTSPSFREIKGEGWYQRSKQNTTSARFDYEHSDQLSVTALLGSSTDSNRDIQLDTNQDDFFQTKKLDYSVQANQIFSSKNQISFGIDYQKDKISSANNYAATERTNKGLFALWQNQLDRSSTVFSARHDKNNSYGSISNYSVQQSFAISNLYEIVGSYGTAFKAPTFNDLYWPDVGNPNLSPEESKSFEISLRFSRNEVNWQINAYQTKVQNLIAWAPIPNDPDNRWSPFNVNSAKMKGIEFDLAKRWESYSANVSVGYLDAEDESTGRFLDGRARLSGSLELGKQIDNLYLGVDTYFEHARFDGSRKLPGYSVWGITARYDFSDTLSISGRIDNLFDKEYVTNLASSDNPYQNEGRTIEMSLEYRF